MIGELRLKAINKRFNINYVIITFVALVLSYIVISFGIWTCNLPFGDECGYIQEGMRIADDSEFTSNLYLLSYAAIFKFTDLDPASAHSLIRFISSLLSVLLVYALLKCIKIKINNLAVLFVCVLWMNCHVNIPPIQYGNINIFTLDIAMLGIVLFLRENSLNRFLICMSCFLFCAKIRPEYWIAVILMPSYIIFNIRRSFKKIILLQIKSAATGTIVLLASIILIFSGKGSSRSYDQYLFLGLSQCYTALYVKINPDVKLNVMQEYNSLIDEVFDKPTGFIDAAIKNPLEIMRYFAINGFANSILLIPSLLDHRQIVPTSILPRIVMLILIISIPVFAISHSIFSAIKSAGGVYRIMKTEYRKIFRYIKELFVKRIDISFLIILALVSVISIFLLIPDPRYWVSCIPIILLWLAWGFTFAFEHVKRKYLLFTIVAGICILMSRPMFLEKEGNRVMIEMLKQHYSKIQIDNPVVAGHTSVGTYIFKKYYPMNIAQMDSNSFLKGDFDYFIFDRTVVDSIFWQKNELVIIDFIKRPQNYGYMLIYVFQNNGEMIAAYGRKPIRTI